MIPNITQVARTKVDWGLLRAVVSETTGLQPSAKIAQSPVKMSEAAEVLLFAAYMLLDITDEEPHNVLLTLPHECMNFLHYTFFIICDVAVMEDLREKTRAHYTITDVGKSYCILGTGPLSVWYDAIVLNLTYSKIAYKAMYGMRVLLDKLLLLFEKEGLHALFSKYKKKTLSDKTFLLE